jgi:hypothetical protein
MACILPVFYVRGVGEVELIQPDIFFLPQWRLTVNGKIFAPRLQFLNVPPEGQN